MRFLTLPPTPRKATLTAAFNPDQERDENGRWTSDGDSQTESVFNKSKPIDEIMGTAEERKEQWGGTKKEVFESLREQFPEVKFSGDSTEMPLNELTAHAEGLKFAAEQMPNVMESVDIIEFESKDDGVTRGETIISGIGGIQINLMPLNKAVIVSEDWSAIEGNSEVLAFGTAVHEMSHVAMAVYTVNYEAKNSGNPELESPTLAPKDYTQKGWAGRYKTADEFREANFRLSDPRRTGLDFQAVSEYALSSETEAFAEGLSNSLVYALGDPNVVESEKVFDLLKEGHPITPSLKTALLPVDSVLGGSRISQFRVDLQNDSTTKKGLVASASINTDELDSIILITEFVEGTWIWDFVHAANTITAAFNPDQERDAGGKWTSGGGEPKTGKVDISEIKPGADLSGRNLSGMDLTRMDLTGINFSDANLQGVKLSGAILTNAVLTGANLSLAELSVGSFDNANLRYADLHGSNLNGANLHGADLNSANLSLAYLSYANLSGASLRNADLSGADLSNADLTGARMQGANLTDADLQDANLRRTKLSDADLTDANLQGANLAKVDLSGVDLQGANLREANLENADLRGANLTRVNFYATKLTDADFTGADLTKANLYGANLSGVNLSDANLTSANINNTNLLETNFTGANIKDATFISTNLDEVDFSKAINNPMEKAEKENADRLEAAKGSAEFSTQAIQPIEAYVVSKDTLVDLSEDWSDPEFYRTEAIDDIKGVGLFFGGADPERLKEAVAKQIEDSAYFGAGTGNGLPMHADSFQTAREYTDAWQSSANKSPQSEMIQESASRVLFNQEVIKPEGWEDYYRAQSDQAELVVFEMYQRTQKEFADAGYKPDDTITLYRGVKEDSLDLMPMSSWTLSTETANYFAKEGQSSGTVFGAEVPIANIVSLPTTGVGCLGEFEVVVLNKPAET
jgi:uncharacterized protein YjbI with pentapeptide repeats